MNGIVVFCRGSSSMSRVFQRATLNEYSLLLWRSNNSSPMEEDFDETRILFACDSSTKCPDQACLDRHQISVYDHLSFIVIFVENGLSKSSHYVFVLQRTCSISRSDAQAFCSLAVKIQEKVRRESIERRIVERQKNERKLGFSTRTALLLGTLSAFRKYEFLTNIVFRTVVNSCRSKRW